jgi:hypothetical protein
LALVEKLDSDDETEVQQAKLQQSMLSYRKQKIQRREEIRNQSIFGKPSKD